MVVTMREMERLEAESYTPPHTGLRLAAARHVMRKTLSPAVSLVGACFSRRLTLGKSSPHHHKLSFKITIERAFSLRQVV